MDDYVSLSLKRDLALVLFDWLARTTALGRPADFADQAEQRVLWDLESVLESLLPEVLQDDYSEQMGKARDRVRDNDA